MTYYDKELQKLGERQADIQLRSIEGQTRWMTITPEQVQAILEILNKTEVTAWNTQYAGLATWHMALLPLETMKIP